jgi:hypothetical protein
MLGCSLSTLDHHFKRIKEIEEILLHTLEYKDVSISEIASMTCFIVVNQIVKSMVLFLPLIVCSIIFLPVAPNAGNFVRLSCTTKASHIINLPLLNFAKARWNISLLFISCSFVLIQILALFLSLVSSFSFFHKNTGLLYRRYFA